MMYAWASPGWVLDHMSLDQILLYYREGIDFLELKARMVGMEVLFGLHPELRPKQKEKAPIDEKPDKAAFYRHYGDKIRKVKQ